MTADELLAKVRAAGAAGFRLPDGDVAAVLASYALSRRGLVKQSPTDAWTLLEVTDADRTVSRSTFRLAGAISSTSRGRKR